jgi:hypothetical protein
VKRLLGGAALVASLAFGGGASGASGAGDAVGAQGEQKPSVVIWPTLTPAGDAPGSSALHRPQPATDRSVVERAQELDATLRDAVQDLGFSLFVADTGPSPGHTRDADLVRRAASSAAGGEQDGGTWVVSPRVESAGGDEYVVRIVAVPPRGRELRVRVETVAGDSVSARGLVMLRDLLSAQTAARAAVEGDLERSAKGSTQGVVKPVRSQGRAVLAVNAGLFGAYTAFSLQKASGSEDPRVLYPLLALGTGMGVGAALLVADEWDVTTGDAGFLAAGAWWGAASALLVSVGRDVTPINDRYAIGVGGGLVGLGLATLAVTQRRMDEGDATLAHSGAAFGLLAGGAIEMFYRGTTTNIEPYTGMGYGTGFGLLAAGALASLVTVSPSRVLLVDVGLGGGALIGAAAASPLLFENVTQASERGWLAATMAGSVVGGAAAWWLTRDGAPSKAPAWLRGLPSAGVIATTPTRAGDAPVYGVSWTGGL